MKNELDLDIAHMAANPHAEISNLTVGDLLRQAASEVPSRIALKSWLSEDGEPQSWTYAELLHKVTQTAQALLKHFEPGERVAIWSHNVAEWWLIQFGAATAGLVLVTVDPALTEREVRYILDNSNAVGLFAQAAYRDEDRSALLNRLQGDLPTLRHVVRLGDLDAFVRSAEVADRQDVGFPDVHPDQLVMIQYTSGTTGMPKGAALRHRGVVNTSKFATERFELPLGSVWLNCMPLFSNGGSVHSTLGTLWNRGTMLMMPRFDAHLALRLIDQEGANWITTVPTMAIRLLDHPSFAEYSMKTLEVHACGGAPVAPELIKRIESAMGCDFVMIYGQTEMSGMICQTTRSDTIEHKSLTVGFPLGPTEVKISQPENGEPVRAGEVGEICYRSFAVLAHYHQNDQATRESIQSDGWFRTGDLGTLRSDGYLTITGRIKDMVITGGENIYPRQIEDELISHPGVAEVAVFGVPHPSWGEELVAAVRAKRGAEISEHELEAFLRSRLAGKKIPRRWWFRDMPTTQSGKIQKFLLRKQYIEKHETSLHEST